MGWGGRQRSAQHQLVAPRADVESACNPTLAGENYAMVAATAPLEWTVEQYDELANAEYQQDPRACQAVGQAQRRRTPTWMALFDNLPEEVTRSLTLTDVKPLCGSLKSGLKSEMRVKEPRVVLVVAEI